MLSFVVLARLAQRFRPTTTMNILDVKDQATRLIDNAYRQSKDYLTDNSRTEEPAIGKLWDQACPHLDKALLIYDKKDSTSTPDSTWNPFGESKESCQKELEKILDALLLILGACGAAGYRKRIRSLQADITASHHRIGECGGLMVSAPSEASLNAVEGLWIRSRESLQDQIADENDSVAERKQQIETMKVAFRDHLKEIGIDFLPETADSFLLPIEDEIVSMAAVISNIGRLTEQLQHLVEECREAPSHTKRYYGIYVLLVLAVDRIEQHFILKLITTSSREWRDSRAKQTDTSLMLWLNVHSVPTRSYSQQTLLQMKGPFTPAGSWPIRFAVRSSRSSMRTRKRSYSLPQP